MVKLTEGMIIGRTRVNDLEHVTKLNCWGAEISDVTLLRKLPSVQVLSLSVNSINTLADMQFCYELRELYIRKNNIENLSEICYLKNLSKLQSLWLEENPCATGERYRFTVLKALPSLKFLDNIEVTNDQLNDAIKYGLDLYHPEEERDVQYSHEPIKPNADIPTDSSSVIPQHRNQTSNESEPRRASRQESAMQASVYEPAARNEPISNQSDVYSSQQNLVENNSHRFAETRESSENPTHKRMPTGRSGSLFGCSLSMDDSQIQQGFDSRQLHGSNPRLQDIPQGMAAYNHTLVTTRSDSAFYQHQQQQTRRGVLKDSGYEGGVGAYNQFGGRSSLPFDTDKFNSGDGNSYGEARREDCKVTPPSDGNSRGAPGSARSNFRNKTACRNRNSNILSAALCLIKELDHASLEVLEVAIQSRMEELED